MFMAARQVGWRAYMIAGYLLFFGYSVALTDLLRREIKRRQWLEARAAKVVGRLAASVALIGSVQTFLVIAVNYMLTGDPELFARTGAVMSAWVTITAATAIWTIFYVSLSAPHRYREKEVRFELALTRSGVARSRGADQPPLSVQLPELDPGARAGETPSRARHAHAPGEHSALQPAPRPDAHHPAL
jgi:hypothetical protein